MINIIIGLKADLTLHYFQAYGHAGYNLPGEDVVCAAVSCLLRTAAGILSQYQELKVTYQADEPGRMELTVLQLPDEKRERIKGITDFLLKGLWDLQAEYPKNISLSIRNN